MTSVPLPSCQNGNTAKREKSASKYFTEDCSRTRLPRYNVPGSSKMNVFQSISSFLRKNKKVPDRTEQARKSVEKDRVSLAESTCNDDKKVEEDWAETSEVSDDNRDDIAFVRSTFRQSVKRAMGWRKSQRKAVNKRKKENIQNSKLLTGGTKDTGDDEFYDDTELDVVVVTDTDGMPDDPRAKPSSSSSSKHSKIPRRRNSTKRPAVSLKSAGFFSQSVAKRPEKIRSKPARQDTARVNHAPSRLNHAPARVNHAPARVEYTPARVDFAPAAHNQRNSRYRSRTVTSNESTVSQVDNARARLSTWSAERSGVMSRDLNQSRIPRFLGSTCSSPGTPDSLLLNYSDTEDSVPWRNIEIVHTRTESQPASRTTSVSSSLTGGGRTRSATTGGRVRSSTTGSRCPSSLSSSWGRNTSPRNSKSTSNISSAVSNARPQLTRSQSRIPRYLGSSSSISSLSPMSADYRHLELDFDFADLDSDSDSSERTRCASTSKRSEGGKTVTARTNKASELREVAIKKKLENSPAQSAMIPVPAPARRKARTSFRTKKGISRKPVQKKEIKPAQNKASQLRAKIHQEEGGDEETRQTSDQSEKTNSSQNERSKEPESRRTDRFSSVAIKTPAPSSDTRDPLSVAQSPRRDSATVRTSGRAVKTVPQKPTRSKIPSSSSTSSNIPSPSPRLAPSSLPLSKSSDDFQTRKYSGRSEKTSSNIPKPRLSSPLDPTKELVFIPLDSVSLPLPGERVKIDEVTRKRKIQRPAASPSVRPVSNIFDGGAGDLPPSNLRRQCSTDDSDSVFTVHVNKTPARSVSTTPKPRTSVSKPKLSSSVPNTSAIPSHIMAPRKNSTGCDGKTAGKPKQVQNLSNFKRQNSIDSSRRSKKGIPAISLLSESCPSESSDNTCSYDSCRSLDEDDFSLSRSPPLSDSPKLSKRRLPVLISTDDLETQKEKLRTPKKRSGSIRVKQVRTRKSWLRPEVIDPEMEKVKSVLSDEVLIIEDLISGHQDILQTLSSRTLVLKNMTSALRRNDTERAARMCISLCFPRSHSDSEFKTMRRACQCNTDDLALFQNCLSLLLVEREKLTLPVVEILLSKVRFTFEVLGSEVLRGNIGEILKLITGSFGTKIAHRHSTPGLNYRLQEIAESCYQELIIVQKHVLKLAAVDYSPELMALKKTLELFDL
ncbi:hypothetical protein ACHWQZ_G010285 [Mnemiopsis leidyi]